MGVQMKVRILLIGRLKRHFQEVPEGNISASTVDSDSLFMDGFSAGAGQL